MSTVTDEIKARVDLVELIGRVVQLKRVGGSYKGLCPFHTEKTPSFYVRPQTGTYHCFGCGKHGSAFDWLMEREHLEFGEALRQLAQITGVAVPEHRKPDEDEHVRRLYSILERTQTYYAAVLWGTAGERARAYMQGRGFSDETLKTFGIGYALRAGGLQTYLQQDGFSEQELQAAGVIGIADDGRPYDFFRERVLFPIRDTQGRTIAFGGRSLEDGVTPKYLNTRDTLLFHKQETLFALDLARRPMAQERQVVIVEGYMDAAVAHQHGFRNVVATLGTAMTPRHMSLLRRHVDEIVLALDPDAAGAAAVDRLVPLALETFGDDITTVLGRTRREQRRVYRRDMALRVLVLPDGQDPDELIRRDPNAWTSLVRQATPVIDFVLERLAQRHDLTTAVGKAAAASDVVQVLAGIANPIEQDHYAGVAAGKLKVEPETLLRLLRRTRRNVPAQQPPEPQRVQPEGNAHDEYLLALVIRARLMNVPEAPAVDEELEFVLPENRAVYRSLGGSTPVELQPYVDRANRYLEDVERLAPHRIAEEIERTRDAIRTWLLEAKRRELNALLRDGADESEVAQLLDQTARQLPP
ncbi:MAG: DNA primase, partial [Chloroflexi bacterium]|nr:DNA primase [Chloroflexota bacterium]